jgi:histidine ammonia-lyase
MSEVLFGEHPSAVADIVAVARDYARVGLAEKGQSAIKSGYSSLLQVIAAGSPIYGVTTGLGAAVDTKLGSADPALQRRIPAARSVGVGPSASSTEVRAIMAARLSRLAQGHSGISPAAAHALAGLLNARVHPVTPMIGSVGEADLVPLAHIASVVFGDGEAEVGGVVMPGAAALARSGLLPPEYGPKDGLALVSSNAASVGIGALLVHDARHALGSVLAASLLSLEGFRGNLSPFSAAAVKLHPLPGFDRVAGRVMELLAGGDLLGRNAARRLQDPLSFRCLGPVHAAALSALDNAAAIVEIELNSSDDNPAILSDEVHVLPNANFDATHLALAFEALGLALARVAALSGQRVLQLMSPGASDLPRFLAPPLVGRSGFSALQKTVSALVAEIQHKASPMPVVILAVADHIEDYGTMALSSVRKVNEIVERLNVLAGIELMVAAQACDLRSDIVLGEATTVLYKRLRQSVAKLDEDRPITPDIAASVEVLRDQDLVRRFCP